MRIELANQIVVNSALKYPKTSAEYPPHKIWTWNLESPRKYTRWRLD